MPNPKRPIPPISDAAERSLQAGIANDASNPELTDDQLARMQPASDILSPELFSALTRPRGRPKAGSTKEPVKLRIDPAVVARFRAAGPGWQTRMNAFLSVNDTILQMIIENEALIADMEVMLGQFQSGELRMISEPAERTVDRVGRNVRNVKETVRSLREQLIFP